MPKFLDILSLEQKTNVITIIDCMKRNGIANTMIQAGILAVISQKVCSFRTSKKIISKLNVENNQN